MPAAIPIYNDTLSKGKLEELARNCRVTRIRKWLKAIVQILCDWVNLYNA